MAARLQTARRGNPGQASRGAGARRARQELLDALDQRIEPMVNRFVDRLLLSELASVVGCDPAAARQRFETATVGELTNWTEEMRLRTRLGKRLENK